MSGLSDIVSAFGPILVGGIALTAGYFLAARGIKEVAKQEVRSLPIQQILQTMGFKSSKIYDLNKLTPEAFQMLRQLLYDMYTYQGVGTAQKTNKYQQAMEMLKQAAQVKSIGTQQQQNPNQPVLTPEASPPA